MSRPNPGIAIFSALLTSKHAHRTSNVGLRKELQQAMLNETQCHEPADDVTIGQSGMILKIHEWICMDCHCFFLSKSLIWLMGQYPIFWYYGSQKLKITTEIILKHIFAPFLFNYSFWWAWKLKNNFSFIRRWVLEAVVLLSIEKPAYLRSTSLFHSMTQNIFSDPLAINQPINLTSTSLSKVMNSNPRYSPPLPLHKRMAIRHTTSSSLLVPITLAWPSSRHLARWQRRAPNQGMKKHCQSTTRLHAR